MGGAAHSFAAVCVMKYAIVLLLRSLIGIFSAGGLGHGRPVFFWGAGVVVYCD
jgi:hypothetical protein